jgi:hypothetical protein
MTQSLLCSSLFLLAEVRKVISAEHTLADTMAKVFAKRLITTSHLS